MNRNRRAMGLVAPILLLVLLATPGALARQTTDDGTIAICHANRSLAHPYTLRTVANDTTYDGHLAHRDIPLDVANLSWPDIIPAPQDANGESYCPETPPTQPDDPVTGSITIHKIDQDGNPIPGACFNLGSVRDFRAAQSGANCTNESGELVIAGLTVPGTYQLAEESTPAGCAIDDDLPAVTLSAEAPDQRVTVTNTCQSAEPTATLAPTTPATAPATAPATVAPTLPATVPATARITPAGNTPAATVTALPTTGAGAATGADWTVPMILGAVSLLLSSAMLARRSRH